MPTTIAPRARAIEKLTALLLLDEGQDMPAMPTTSELRLYFDGGSCGNPGTAGSGSVLVQRDDPTSSWNVLWWDWCYIGDHATNNEAEHTGLMRGLEASHKYRDRQDGHGHLTIIGDRQLVLSQLNGDAQYKDDKLHRLLRRSQVALRTDPRYNVLLHTLRAGNKLAAWLSNQAMDKQTTRSSTETWTEVDTALTDLLPTVDHPEFTNQPPHRPLN